MLSYMQASNKYSIFFIFLFYFVTTFLILDLNILTEVILVLPLLSCFFIFSWYMLSDNYKQTFFQKMNQSGFLLEVGAVQVLIIVLLEKAGVTQSLLSNTFMNFYVFWNLEGQFALGNFLLQAAEAFNNINFMGVVLLFILGSIIIVQPSTISLTWKTFGTLSFLVFAIFFPLFHFFTSTLPRRIWKPLRETYYDLKDKFYEYKKDLTKLVATYLELSYAHYEYRMFLLQNEWRLGMAANNQEELLKLQANAEKAFAFFVKKVVCISIDLKTQKKYVNLIVTNDLTFIYDTLCSFFSSLLNQAAKVWCVSSFLLTNQTTDLLASRTTKTNSIIIMNSPFMAFSWLLWHPILVILLIVQQDVNVVAILPKVMGLINIDELSLPFLMLSTVIIHLCIFIVLHNNMDFLMPSETQLKESSENLTKNAPGLTTVKGYIHTQYTKALTRRNTFILYILNLYLLLFFLLLAFSANDLLLFYFAFESTVLPMYFLLGFFGSRPRRIKAAYYLFLYTIFGSVLILLAIFWIILDCKTTLISDLMYFNFDAPIYNLVWLGFFLGFGVKIPLIPLHSWLAEAHVEAPTIGSVVLAALLLKLGGYGYIRVLILLLPQYTVNNIGLAMMFFIFSFFYASFVAMRQFDLKRIIAYSSIAHMNFALLGTFSFTVEGFLGSIFLMVAHGLTSAGLFIAVGLLYETYGSRIIFYYGGLIRYWPRFAALFLSFLLANFGFPCTANFIGELLIIIGLTNLFPLLIVFILVGTILTVAYCLIIYWRIFLGTPRDAATFVGPQSIFQLNTISNENSLTKAAYTIQRRQIVTYYIVLMFLLFLVVWFGLFPAPINTIVQHFVVSTILRYNVF